MMENDDDIYSENYTEEYSAESENESLYSLHSEGYRKYCVNVDSILEDLTNEAVIKIEQIQQISGNISYTPDMLWEMLFISKINEAFEEATENNHTKVEIYAPPAPKGSAELQIDLIISNKAAYDAPLSLRRIKCCECKTSQKKVGHINLYLTNYDLCPHRPLFQIEPISMVIKSKEYRVIQFHIRYNFKGEHRLQYELSMSHGRKVYLGVMVHVLSDECPPYVLPMAIRNDYPEGTKFVTRLQPVCIADLDPPFQFLWLSNGYDTPVEYSVECKQGWPIFNISEGYNSGVAPPFSLQPVVVLFRPQQVHDVEFILVVNSGSTSTEWLIYGPTLTLNAALLPPVSHPDKKQLLRAGTLPTRLPTSMSTTNIALTAICHGNQESAVHMENLSDKCIEYEWEKGPPCVGTITLGCHIVVLEPQVIWDQSGWFTITEKGYSQPVPPSPPIEFQYDLNLSLRVRVLQCCDSVRGLLCCREPECLPAPPPRYCIIQSPIPRGILLGSPEPGTMNPERRLQLLHGFFDRVLWDVIWCPLFRRSLGLLDEEAIPLYSQVRTKYDKSERKLLSFPYMSVIIQELLYKSLHEAFQLSSKKVMKQYETTGEDCIISPDIYWPSESSEIPEEKLSEELQEEEEYYEPEIVIVEPEQAANKNNKKEKRKKAKKY